MALHERLREILEDRDMQQAELAVILGTTRQQVSKYLCGTQDMTASRLAAVCLALGVSADYLLGLPEDLARPR